MLKTLVERRFYLIVLLQVLIIVASYGLAHLLRFDFRVPDPYLAGFWQSLLPVLLIKVTVFYGFGLFTGWWRYVSMSDLIGIFKANALATLVITAVFVFYNRFEGIPRSVIALDGIICFLLIGGVRFATRAWRENYLPLTARPAADAKRLLVIGAGNAGQAIVRELRLNRKLALEPVGYVDDDPQKIGNTFHGLKVLGATSDIPRICAGQRIDEAVIAIPSAPGRKIREIVEACTAAGVHYKTLPGYGGLINGQVSYNLIREVDLEDLLGRNPVTLDVDGIRQYLTDRTVLVTGAAGSIGSELCRQIARFSPQRIVLLDMAETPLFFIERELVASFPQIPVAAVIGDVRDSAQLTAVFAEFAPQTVFHAAAYKHVPLMEYNPCSAVLNNIKGTLNVAETADRCGVDTFVMISTDKAVNPANIMGASKRIAEMTVQSLAQSSRTHFVTVRFGNVLGSNGSVVPIFKEQIRRGGPVTVTHPEVTRFFMTIHEAAQLVLQAGSMGKGGEIFLLDMGEPVRIVHMAEELIRLSGLRPYEDIDITFTGLRPGEKLYEELLLASEGTQATRHEKIWIARAQAPDAAALHVDLEVLFAMAMTLDEGGVVRQMKRIVPEFAAEVSPQLDHLE